MFLPMFRDRMLAHLGARRWRRPLTDGRAVPTGNVRPAYLADVRGGATPQPLGDPPAEALTAEGFCFGAVVFLHHHRLRKEISANTAAFGRVRARWTMVVTVRRRPSLHGPADSGWHGAR